MSLMSLLTHHRPLDEKKRRQRDEQLAQLVEENEGIAALLAEIREQPVAYYISHFTCGMERIELLGPREVATLQKEQLRFERELGINDLRIDLLRKQCSTVDVTNESAV